MTLLILSISAFSPVGLLQPGQPGWATANVGGGLEGAIEEGDKGVALGADPGLPLGAYSGLPLDPEPGLLLAVYIGLPFALYPRLPLGHPLNIVTVIVLWYPLHSSQRSVEVAVEVKVEMVSIT